MFGEKYDIIMIIAILVAPIIAVLVNRLLVSIFMERSGILELFKTLVISRRDYTNEMFQNALMLARLEFSKKFYIRRWKNQKYAKVLEALNSYVDKIGKAPRDSDDLAENIKYREDLRSLQDIFLSSLADSIGESYNPDKFNLHK